MRSPLSEAYESRWKQQFKELSMNSTLLTERTRCLEVARVPRRRV
jgi:hypothetical protein